MDKELLEKCISTEEEAREFAEHRFGTGYTFNIQLLEDYSKVVVLKAIPIIQEAGEEIARAQLTLLVAEIQRCDTLARIKEILDSWIVANELEPEKVRQFKSVEDVLAYFKGETNDKPTD